MVILRIMGWIVKRLSRWVDFRSKESRWEFTAILFGASLFVFSLFPAFYALAISPDGGVVMSPFLILAWVFFGIGMCGLFFVILFVAYFRRDPIDDPKIQIQRELNKITKELSKLNKRLNKNDKSK